MTLEWEILWKVKEKSNPLAAGSFLLCAILVLILVGTIKIKYYQLNMFEDYGPKNLDSVLLNCVIAIISIYSGIADYYLSK